MHDVGIVMRVSTRAQQHMHVSWWGLPQRRLNHTHFV